MLLRPVVADDANEANAGEKAGRDREVGRGTSQDVVSPLNRRLDVVYRDGTNDKQRHGGGNQGSEAARKWSGNYDGPWSRAARGFAARGARELRENRFSHSSNLNLDAHHPQKGHLPPLAK